MTGDPINLADVRAARHPPDHTGPNTFSRADILTRLILNRPAPPPEEVLRRLLKAFLTHERMEALGLLGADGAPTREEIDRAWIEAWHSGETADA